MLQAEESIDRINCYAAGGGLMEESSAKKYTNRLRRLAGVEQRRSDPLAAAAAMGIKVIRSETPSLKNS